MALCISPYRKTLSDHEVVALMSLSPTEAAATLPAMQECLILAIQSNL